MTAHSEFPDLNPAPDARQAARTDEIYWGYIIRARDGFGSGTQIKQWVAGLIGLGAVASAVGFWVLPGAFFSEDVAIFKMVISFMTCSIGIFLLFYASAGCNYELQVDKYRKEIREVFRNNKGQSRLHNKYSFSDVQSVFVSEMEDESGLCQLIIQVGKNCETIIAATSGKNQIIAMRDRLNKMLSAAASKKTVKMPKRVQIRDRSQNGGTPATA